MSDKLYYTPGNPDYLKVVLLKETSTISAGRSTTSEECGAAANGTLFDLTSNLVLEVSSGDYLTSANEICRYLCGAQKDIPGQAGPAQEEDTEIGSWLEWEETKLKIAVQLAVTEGIASDELHSSLSDLEKALTSGDQHIVKGKLSLADIVVWSSLYVVFASQEPAMQGLHKTFPSISKWFATLAEQKAFSTSVRKASGGEGLEGFKKFLMTEAQARPEDSGASASEPITANEIHHVTAVWSKGSKDVPKPAELTHPILPIPGKRNVLITSALPYVNNVPHLGNIIGCVLSADVFARYCRLRNYNTLYICGTDEYGTATETKALEEGLTPQEICAKYFAVHSDVYEWFNIEFDYFGRTSTPQQTTIAQDIFWRLQKNGYIIQDRVQQLHCRNCDRFLADRFVEGTCPFCSYEDARGDQCDKCSKLINALELKHPRCKICSNEPQVRDSDHLFLDLTKLQEEVKMWSEDAAKTGVWSPNSQYVTTSWIRDGLKPRCISRDLKWGTPVPLEGYTDKVFYVWFDAPIGYLSITACYTEQWEKWWKNPKEVELYQYMAKDNIPFHTVVFPCSLIGARDNYTLLNHISATEYLNYEDGKFSKSRGVGVFGSDAKETNIPADVYRFYLLYIRPETQDSIFSWADFVRKHNTELLNNLGNFVNRCLVFLKKNFNGTIPPMELTEEDLELLAKVTRELKAYIHCLEKQKIRKGLKHVLAISRLGNGHIQATSPWTLIKGGAEEVARAGCVIGVCTNIVCLLSTVIQPYMPTVSKQIRKQLQAPAESLVLLDSFVPFLQPGHTIGEPHPLFTKIDEEQARSLKKRFSGKQMAPIQQ